MHEGNFYRKDNQRYLSVEFEQTSICVVAMAQLPEHIDGKPNELQPRGSVFQTSGIIKTARVSFTYLFLG